MARRTRAANTRSAATTSADVGTSTRVGGTTYGGTGVYGAQIGGVWDALLGEGRNFWFFASSDWHNRGMFGPDDRRSSQDFYPGEYQRDLRDGARRRRPTRTRTSELLTPQAIVDGLRTGNSFAASGQLIDRLAFVVCADTRAQRRDRQRCCSKRLAVVAAKQNTDVDCRASCATMGEKLVVRPGAEVVVAIVVRDPSGTNYSPYTFPNPSLAQVGITQPLNKPVLDHIDVIRGLVTGLQDAGRGGLLGPVAEHWISNPRPGRRCRPARRTRARTWCARSARAPGTPCPATSSSRSWSFRIRGVNAVAVPAPAWHEPAGRVPFETDADGNPLADLWTNAAAINPTLPGGTDGTPANANLRIPCTTVGTNVPDTATTYTGTAIDGCPAHLPVVNGQKMVGVRRRGLGGPVVLQQSDLHRGEGLDRWSPASSKPSDNSSDPERRAATRGAFSHLTT